MNKEILNEEQKYFGEVKKVIGELIIEANQKIEDIQATNRELFQDMHNDFKIDDEFGIDFDGANRDSAILRNGIYEDSQHERISSMEIVKNSPFFGKVDYTDEIGENQIYIGLRGVQQGKNLYVIDWRTPVCALYYHSNLGDTFYKVNNQAFSVNLKTKRQFDVENGQLVGYIDTNEKVNDELLVKVLSGHTSNYMKNIVKTIQEEQDEVIRQKLNENIIVSGVAGSGKTSIAMHRNAYLLFDNKDNLTNEDIIFISPNSLFSSYIAHLLPELGEKNVYSYSLYEIFRNKKFVNFEVETRGEMIDEILNGNEHRHREYNNKFSSKYLEELTNYIAKLLRPNLFYELKILPPLLIDKLFYIGNESYKIFDRISLICERIAEQKKLFSAQKTALKMRMINIILKNFNVEQIYFDFMKKMNLDANKSHYDNLPTYVFINMCFSNYESDNYIKHIVIDEMQDYDAVSLKIVSILYKKATLTILGDYYQNLIGKERNLSSIENTFENSNLIELKISYRSSASIIGFANSVLGENIAENHFREGELPSVYGCGDEKEMIEKIKEKIDFAIKNKEKVAILVKTKEQASNLHKKLDNCTLIIDDKNTEQIESDIIISTIYLCKGLEFDSVIIPYLSQENYHSDLDKNNLYVAITRSLHSVSGYFYGEKSEFVREKYLKKENN